MPRCSRRLLVCLGALVGSAGGALGLPIVDLQPGAGGWQPIARGTIQVLRFRAPADTFVVLAVEQDHVDVEVTVVDPGGRRLPPVDSPIGEMGTERAVFVTAVAG